MNGSRSIPKTRLCEALGDPQDASAHVDDDSRRLVEDEPGTWLLGDKELGRGLGRNLPLDGGSVAGLLVEQSQSVNVKELELELPPSHLLRTN